MLTKLLIL